MEIVHQSLELVHSPIPTCKSNLTSVQDTCQEDINFNKPINSSSKTEGVSSGKKGCISLITTNYDSFKLINMDNKKNNLEHLANPNKKLDKCPNMHLKPMASFSSNTSTLIPTNTKHNISQELFTKSLISLQHLNNFINPLKSSSSYESREDNPLLKQGEDQSLSSKQNNGKFKSSSSSPFTAKLPIIIRNECITTKPTSIVLDRTGFSKPSSDVQMDLNGQEVSIVLQNPNFLAQVITEGMRLATNNFLNHQVVNNIINPLTSEMAPLIYHNMQHMWGMPSHLNLNQNLGTSQNLQFFSPMELSQENPLFFPWIPQNPQMTVPPPFKI